LSNKKKLGTIPIILILLTIGVLAAGYYYYNVSGEAVGTGFRAIILYADGTEETYEQPTGLMPHSIMDPNSGKQVISVRVELYVTPTFTGTVTSWNVAAGAGIKIFDDNYNQVYASTPMDISMSGGSLSSGVAKVVSSSTITATTLESLYGGWSTANNYYYSMDLTTPLTMGITFSDGATASKTVSTTSGFYWEFTYMPTGEFTSLSVNWGIVPYT